MIIQPVHNTVVTAWVVTTAIFHHMMVDGMDKVVVKQLQYFLHMK